MSNKGIYIYIPSCKKCPCDGLCSAWEKLTPKERLVLVFGNGIPDTFILARCPFNKDIYKIEPPNSDVEDE